ncbi:hypothetical protein STENM327S_01700 [Streptomyces tendae]
MSTVRERSVPRGTAGRGALWPYLLVAPAVLGMLYLLLYPLARAVLISFQDFRLRQLILGDAEFVGLRNYRTLSATRSSGRWCAAPSCSWRSTSSRSWCCPPWSR